MKNYEKRYAQGRPNYFDGLTFVPTLLGKDKKQKQHDFLYWEFCETDQIAVRQGDWKLFVEKGECTSTTWPTIFTKTTTWPHSIPSGSRP